MFIGHFAVGFAAKRHAPRASFAVWWAAWFDRHRAVRWGSYMSLVQIIGRSLTLLLACGLVGCALAQDAALPDRLIVTDQEVGRGTEVRRGMFAVVHYTGWVYDPAAPDRKGKRYISSRERGEALSYVYGVGRAIRGFERGLQGMRVGGKRTIVIPPKLGYEEPKYPYPQDVPKGSALVFELELLDVVPQSAPPDQ